MNRLTTTKYIIAITLFISATSQTVVAANAAPTQQDAKKESLLVTEKVEKDVVRINSDHPSYEDFKGQFKDKDLKQNNVINKPWLCMAPDCDMRCGTKNGLIYHILSIHCTPYQNSHNHQSTHRTSPYSRTSILGGDFICMFCNQIINHLNCIQHQADNNCFGWEDEFAHIIQGVSDDKKQ